ncbi:MAG: UDP-N-acetylglucosamine diphosphorylase/glucosamine-1-phosphate N-acetyltransferase, partial [Thermotogae bacterium]
MKCLVLAAGIGKRMKSRYSKVLHPVCGKPMIEWVLRAVQSVASEIAVVLGHGADEVRTVLPQNIKVFIQNQQLGTAHAVMCAKQFVSPAEDLLVVYGDTPLLRSETLEKCLKVHRREKPDVTIISARMSDPSGYGRVVRDSYGSFQQVIEERDIGEFDRSLSEVNTGVYIFRGEALLEYLPKVTNSNSQQEYYLTDVLHKVRKVTIFEAEDSQEFLGVNTRVQLAEAERIMRMRICERMMLQGVTIVDPNSTYIDDDVVVGRDTTIYPMTFLMGRTVVGEECSIGPMTRIKDCKIGDDTTVISSDCVGAEISDGVTVGPFARLREGTVLERGVRIGNFVEVKKSVLDRGTKAQHLAYLGDSTIGKGVNIGAGTITCNFDGVNKNPTVIEDNVFVGSNTSLVAPVKIG